MKIQRTVRAATRTVRRGEHTRRGFRRNTLYRAVVNCEIIGEGEGEGDGGRWGRIVIYRLSLVAWHTVQGVGVARA